MPTQPASKSGTVACPECGAQIELVPIPDDPAGRLQALCNHGDNRRFPYPVVIQSPDKLSSTKSGPAIPAVKEN